MREKSEHYLFGLGASESRPNAALKAWSAFWEIRTYEHRRRP